MPPPDAPIASAPPPPTQLRLRDMRRLRGRQSTLNLVGSYRLWLAADFLLQLRKTGYTEEFQRFAYRDIQALEICGSSRWWVYNLVLGIPALMLGLLGLGQRGGGGRMGYWIAGGVLLGLLLINLLRGPTCHCVLQTALGPQLLPSLSRQRPARRAVELITERVGAAQGEGRR